MYAVVKTGGKQIKVEPGTITVVELLDAEVGSTVTMVPLLVSDEGNLTTDAKGLEAMAVTAEIVEHFKGDKVLIFKFKKRKGYRRTKGHRQGLTRIKVTAIGAEPKKKPASKVAKADAPKAEAGAKTTTKTKAAPKTEKVAAAESAE
jgi:large subunit ribosomal protein L21